MKRKVFIEGLKDGVPVGLGYFVVAFSFGITARSIGFNWLQAFVLSLTNIASAGEYAVFKVIGENGSYLEMALMVLVANCRYLLMSAVLSQKVSSEMHTIHRFTVSSFLTDEIFALNATRQGNLDPVYSYGNYFASVPAWAVGTAVGVVAGNALPARVTGALSVALFGMFIAIIIPPAKKNKIIAGLIAVSFAVSYASEKIPRVRDLSSGTRIIIITLVISTLAAIIFPTDIDEYAVPEKGEEAESDDA